MRGRFSMQYERRHSRDVAGTWRWYDTRTHRYTNGRADCNAFNLSEWKRTAERRTDGKPLHLADT
jgi:hypothetical protein